MLDAMEEARMELIEKACEFDDDMHGAYLEGEEPSEAALKAALRKGVIGRRDHAGLAGLRLQEQRHPAGAGRGGRAICPLPLEVKTG
jgi:translation elongation factor EF-G